MKNIENFVTLLLLMVLPGQFIVQVLPFYGLSSVSSLIVSSRFVLSLAILFYIVSNIGSFIVTKEAKKLFALYVLYFSFVMFYVFISPQIPRELMMDVPETNSIFFITLLQQSILIFIFAVCANKIRYALFAKWTTIITLLCIIVYFSVVDPRIYGILDTMDLKEAKRDEVQFIGVFMISGFIASGFCSAISLYEKWCKNTKLDWLILFSTSILLFLSLLIIVKRGPIISASLSLCILLYFRYKKMSSGKKLFCFMFLTIALIGLDSLGTSLSQNFENGILYRFSTIFETGGSGRFGDEDSVFSLAVSQFLSNPIVGSYFRITTGQNIGEYPHNIVLELLLTCGFFISIFYFIALWKVIKKVIMSIEEREVILPIALLFIYVIMAMMFSSSIIFHTLFWTTWALLQGYTINKIEYCNE